MQDHSGIVTFWSEQDPDCQSEAVGLLEVSYVGHLLTNEGVSLFVR